MKTFIIALALTASFMSPAIGEMNSAEKPAVACKFADKGTPVRAPDAATLAAEQNPTQSYGTEATIAN